MKTFLCGRQKCCPELHTASNGTISITDDYGGIVTMTKEQWDDIKTRETK